MKKCDMCTVASFFSYWALKKSFKNHCSGLGDDTCKETTFLSCGLRLYKMQGVVEVADFSGHYKGGVCDAV